MTHRLLLITQSVHFHSYSIIYTMIKIQHIKNLWNKMSAWRNAASGHRPLKRDIHYSVAVLDCDFFMYWFKVVTKLNETLIHASKSFTQDIFCLFHFTSLCVVSVSFFKVNHRPLYTLKVWGFAVFSLIKTDRWSGCSRVGVLPVVSPLFWSPCRSSSYPPMITVHMLTTTEELSFWVLTAHGWTLQQRGQSGKEAATDY